MHKVHLQYLLDPAAPAAPLHNGLVTLLKAISEAGSISAAARQLGQSYRHVWGEVRRWEVELGHPLVDWVKGQRARLTPFGSRLLWAEQLVVARMAPHIEALRADLERALFTAADAQAHVLTVFASHDEALVALREQAAFVGDSGLQPVQLDVRFTGSVDAIRALNDERCVIAGFHALQLPGTGSAAQRAYQPLLRPGRHKLLGFARRAQGLMTRPDTAIALSCLGDVARLGLRLALRAPGTGTRVVLDDLLTREGLRLSDLTVCRDTEPSHTAVAQAVAGGQADVGLGIEAAARARGLRFVPLAYEDYHLVCLKSALDSPPCAALRAVLQSAAWQARLARIPGYQPDHCGEVRSMRAALPWWTFPQRRRPRSEPQNGA